jgi:hypothetical protein
MIVWHCYRFSIANVRVLQVSWVLWYPSILQPSLVSPIICVLSLPGPLNPSITFLVGDDLSFPVLTHEVLVIRAKGRSIACLARTTANVGRAWVGSVIA